MKIKENVSSMLENQSVISREDRKIYHMPSAKANEITKIT